MNRSKALRALTAMTASLLIAGGARAAVVTLDFEGINPHPGQGDILNFYNGGTSANGSSGVNYGVEFLAGAKAFCLNTLDVHCTSASRGGLGDPASQLFGLEFSTSVDTYMNVAAGFGTGLSFNYVSTQYSGDVEIYSGLNGTGDLLASIHLSPNAGSCPDYANTDYCPFSPAGVGFAGTAKSVYFGNVANVVVFDDVTLGRARPGREPGSPTPEPATWAMMLLGFLGVGSTLRGARRRAPLC